MLFRVLGPLEVEVDGALTVPPGAGPRALLTALLLQPNMVVPAYRLAEAVWGRDPPDKFEKALHQVVARVRRALGQASKAIITRPPGYMLVAGASSIDATRFEARYQAAKAAARTDPAAAAALLDEALGLWRGPAYGEFADGFARPAATRLEELRLAALEDRAALLLACGSPTDAAAAASDLAAQQPLRERPVEVLMRSLHAAGRAGEALEAYQRHREYVASELGLDPSPGLRDLEAHILRDDLETAARGHVSSSPVTPAHPPVRALPWRPSTLVGREEELRLLAESLTRSRLVTLVGPGGVGKTRLALEVAHRLADDGRSVWWADLTTVTPGRVVDALADATGADIARTADPAGSLTAALAAHHGVLLLDNAEHLLEPLAAVVERLIDAAPDLVILATSRERLALDQESVRALAPLPLPDGVDRANPAVQLFVDRAPGIELQALSNDDVGVVAEICHHLDGLPLAIELGAARSAAFGVRELADHLDARLDLLAGGRRTAAERHRTLRAVVDWSHELLTDPEAQLFARLAVFPGAFSLDQAESVCADGGLPAAPLVARLVEQSLVQAGQGRFGLLETLRAYAGERLNATGEATWLRQRHARDTARRLAELDGRLWTPDEAAAIAGLNELVVDLHAAWAYAVEHDQSLAVQLAADAYDFAYLRQRLDLLEWAVQAASWNMDHPKLPRVLAAAIAGAWAGGRLDEAAGYAAAIGDHEPAAGRALAQSGNLAMFKGSTEDAMARFRTAGELNRKGGEHVRALLDDMQVEQARLYGGHTAVAREHMERLIVEAHRAENPSTLCCAYLIAGLATEDADPDRALTHFTAAIEHGDTVDCRMLTMLARSSSVGLAARYGTPALALGQFEQVLEQWDRLGNELAQWWVLRYLVVLLGRLEADWNAAVLCGAVLAARDRQPLFAEGVELLNAALASLRGRLGTAADEALAEGATLTLAAAVAHARQAIRAAERAATRP